MPQIIFNLSTIPAARAKDCVNERTKWPVCISLSFSSYALQSTTVERQNILILLRRWEMFQKTRMAGIAALVAMLLSGSALAADKFQLRAADYWDDQYPTVKGLKRMGELLSERTNGRSTLKVFSSGGLGTEKETLEQVKIGALDLVRVNIIADEQYLPGHHRPNPAIPVSLDRSHAQGA
jgi:hypothetical protein